jgi:sarcosine oxidase gamma subunit
MIVALALVVSMAQTQVPQVRDGVITGLVVDASSGRPVGAAIVQITGAPLSGRVDPSRPPGQPRILTGSDGRFVFRDLPAGSFTIAVTKAGYSEGASGRRVIGGTSQPVVLTAAQRTAETSIRMWKNAAITGTIVDEAGEPVVGLQVRALRRTVTGGRRRFAPAGTTATTDDRGAYRLSGLAPAEYLVTTSHPALSANMSAFADVRTGRGGSGAELAAVIGPPGTANAIQVGNAQVMLGRGGAIPPPPVGGRMQIYPPIFYPSALAPAQAMTIALTSGEERIGVDLQLQPVPTVRVAGTLMAPSGPAGLVALRLVPAGVEDIPAEALAPASVTDGAGSFTFAAVPPGPYTLKASNMLATPGPTRGGDLYWLAMPIAVSGDDVDGVVAVMRPSLRISARLEFEGASPKPGAQSQRPGQFTPAPFTLEPDDLGPFPNAMGGMALQSGEQVFTLGGYAAGKYRVRVSGSPTGWMFKSAMLNGVDVSDTPFEFTRDIPDLVLTFTDRWSGIGGTVQGAGAGGAMVLAFTTNPQAWENTGTVPRRLKSTRANAKGEFGISSVPPGEYYVIAVPEEQAADWRDPKALEVLARQATQVSIAEGEHKMIDLRLKDVRQ